MNHLSSRYVDRSLYRTIDILKFFVIRKNKGKLIVSVNKDQTVFKTFCPIHNEKTPSFKLYSHDTKFNFLKEKRSWGYKCFGCGKAGDIFSFLRETEGMQIWESLAFLRKTFPHVENRGSIVGKNQFKIPFPQYQNGDFLWLSEMNQIGFI